MQQGKAGRGDHQVNLIRRGPANILFTTARVLIIKFRQAEARYQSLAQHIALRRGTAA
jgi:hypothetical protein